MPPTPNQQNPPAASPDPQQQAAAAATGPTPTQVTPVDQGATPTTTPTTPMVPAPATSSSAQPQAPGWTQDHGAKHVLGEIFQTLAGGKKIVYTQGPNGPVKTYQDLKPGEMARGILAAAITGLASGYDPANRGKGPAMSSAFASGFKGEEQARDKQQANDQQQAQQQFVNKNMADELILKKQQAAREQQESIVRMAESTAHTAALVQQAHQGAEAFSDARHQHVMDQINQITSDKAAGFKQLNDVTGKPISWPLPEQALESLNKNPDYLLHPGDYDTKVEFDPTKSSYIPMMRPKGYEDKTEERFVKLDKDGNPMTYKDGPNKGQYIPSGIPGEPKPTPMTGKEFGAWTANYNKNRQASADYERTVAETNELRQKQQDDSATKMSTDHWYEAGGKLNAVNPETGTPFITGDERGVLINQAKTNTQLYGKQMKDIQDTELPKATTDQQRADLSAQYAYAKSQYDLFGNILKQAGDKINKSDALAQSLIGAHSDINADGTLGKLDAAAALRQLESNQKKYSIIYSPQELASARQRIQDAAAAQAQAVTAAKAAPASKNAAEDFSKTESKRDEDQMVAAVNQNAQEWQAPARPVMSPPAGTMGSAAPGGTAGDRYDNAAESYIASHPNLTPDERAAVRNQNDIKNGKVQVPTIQTRGANGSVQSIPDPVLAQAIQSLQGLDRNTIRQHIADSPATPQQKAALYNYFYLTPPSSK